MSLLAIAGVLVLYAFIVSTITDNVSQVDMYYTLAPPIYFWVCYFATPTSKGLLLSCLVTLWGARLSFNFARRGGYSGVEDHRWAYVRKWFPNRILWHFFNFAFISVFQNVIILGFSLPAYVLTFYPDQSLSSLDWVCSGLMLLFLTGEAVADQQQWSFQQAKRHLKSEYKGKGYLDSGLFRFSRHPNLFCELSIWWTCYAFVVLATGQMVHWTILGPVGLTMLINGSTNLTESISLSKYPDYALYQQRTSRILPWLPS